LSNIRNNGTFLQSGITHDYSYYTDNDNYTDNKLLQLLLMLSQQGS